MLIYCFKQLLWWHLLNLKFLYSAKFLRGWSQFGYDSRLAADADSSVWNLPVNMENIIQA